MSDLRAGEWVALRPSSLKRRWQHAAAFLTALIAAAFLLKGGFHLSALLICAGLVNAAVAGWLFFASKSLQILKGDQAVRIDGEGVVWLRNASVASVPFFVSNVFVVLKTSKDWMPIWCDALPADAFRRLVVAARWPHRIEPSASATPLV